MARTRGMAKRWGLALILGLALAGQAGAARAADLRITPNLVEIGAFFNGEEVELQAVMPQNATAVVEVLGSAAAEELLRKGRRAGLWMSVGEVQVQDAPSLYLLLSSSPEIPELAGGGTPWGFAALQKRVKFRGGIKPQENGKFFQEFLELKKDEQVYRVMPGALKVSPPQQGKCGLRGKIPLPAKVPQGQYKIRLTLIQDGRVQEQQETDLTVKMVGFPAMLTALAHEQGALYGVMAVVIAIITGFVMGILFKGKAEH